MLLQGLVPSRRCCCTKGYIFLIVETRFSFMSCFAWTGVGNWDGCGNCRSNSAVRSFNCKLSTLTHRALFTQQPPYLASLLHLLNIPGQLRSSISEQLIVPKTKLNLGKRAFSVAAPRVWNELPITLKTSETIAIFRKKLTTYLFQIAFPP